MVVNMYVIIVYDMESERTHIMRKFLREYLTHVQNSVFEGYVTESNLSKIKQYIKSNVEDNESVLIYKLWGESYVDRIVFGEDPMDDNRII